MSEKSVIRYDGPALADHSMDVADLAPALMALSDLLKIANTYMNGDRAGVKGIHPQIVCTGTTSQRIRGNISFDIISTNDLYLQF